MNFTEFVDQAWNDHATQPQEVAARFSEALILVQTPEQIAPMAGLITHVMGEHLAQWEDGLVLLRRLEKQIGENPALARSQAVLRLGLGQRDGLDAFSSSDRVRILATAASALSSSALFDESLTLAFQLESSDPAIRALAITANNMASGLEQMKERTPEQDCIMLNAAQVARKYWAQVGGWLETGRAEYRLAMTNIQLKDFAQAQVHAQNYLDLCEANGADAEELKYAHEALSASRKALSP